MTGHIIDFEPGWSLMMLLMWLSSLLLFMVDFDAV